ncbi:hypothetical protein [Bradyrhizobium sp. RDM4]|uniref:hypothetical protein n=1 Tax=Bradyrhizobium sp. RDM4 TaxID=3378765 RepID=UPI0038FC8D86
MIGAGYGRAAVLHMTPREIMGAFDAAQARRRDQAAERLSIAALGAQGKAASIQKEIDKLSQD